MHEVPQTLDRAGIMRRIPHQGFSCLLDRLCRWNAHSIGCESSTHRSESNPFRQNGRLHAVCAVEYAAQTFALHASLKTQLFGALAPPSVGLLASVREFTLTTSFLDDLSHPLTIDATELVAEGVRMLYSFTLRHVETVVAQGRATVSVLVAHP